ncbi:MAG: ATP-binding protein [Spirochaetes bacterium]|jgi:anti-sigma regulatory factor (Ser/Thr protein kinase)|nr:ATP-binding protein [Spirochaetota bacterium]
MPDQLIVDEQSRLFDTTGMFEKSFPSDFRQIRYFTLLIVQKAPPEMKELHILEQQVSELIKNAVKHGNRSDPEKLVRVWFSFREDWAHLIIQDEGPGFQRLEEWNRFNRERNACLEKRDFEKLEHYVSFATEESDEHDGGNAMFAAVEYWNQGVVFNEKRNAVAVARTFPRKRYGLELEEEPGSVFS